MSKPEIAFKMGVVRAAVFRNIIQHEGKSMALPKVILEVRYRDKAGNWQSTNSLSINDLPKAIAALQKAYEYLLGRQDKGPEAASSNSEPAIKPTWIPGKDRKGL